MTDTAIEVRTEQFTGALLGTAVGDALGLPREGLSRRRAMRMFGGSPMKHALIGRYGMCSDDTEHTCMTAQALLASGGQPDQFARSLSWRLRGWLLCFPAGVGMATARAILKLWIGFRADSSGVWSAGNGPAMRAAIIGVYAHDNLPFLVQVLRASTRLTHSDPAAEHGALAVALAAAYGVMNGRSGVDPDGYIRLVRNHLAGTEILRLLEAAAEQVKSGRSFEDYLAMAGLENGISGYINHTVPAAIFCWLRWPFEFRVAVEQVVVAGGDSDTTGAIVGGLVGATAGADAIPSEWLKGLLEWPRSVPWLTRLAVALSESADSGRTVRATVPFFWPGLLIRNLLFLAVVIVHGLRRLLPPY